MSPLLHRAHTAAFAAATTLLLASDAAFAAAADGDKKVAPPQADYGESTPLSLPSNDAPRQLDSAATSSGGSLVRTFVGLAVVVAVIYGLYWILRQVKAGREERSSGSGLSSQAVVPLGPNRSLHLVRAGRELVLLGVAEHGVTPIRRYTEQEAQQIGLIGTTSDDDGLRPTAPAAGVGAALTLRKPGAMTIGEGLERLRKRTVRT